MATPNQAYKTLRDLGMRPVVARHFVTELRKSGFILVKEKEFLNAKKIAKQIDVIIKLMRLNRRQK